MIMVIKIVTNQFDRHYDSMKLLVSKTDFNLFVAS